MLIYLVTILFITNTKKFICFGSYFNIFIIYAEFSHLLDCLFKVLLDRKYYYTSHFNTGYPTDSPRNST